MAACNEITKRQLITRITLILLLNTIPYLILFSCHLFNSWQKTLCRLSIIFFQQFKMLIGIAEKLIASFEGPVRRAVPVIITADPEKHFPVMKNNAISFPDAHIAVINVIGFSAAAIEFKNEEILS